MCYSPGSRAWSPSSCVNSDNSSRRWSDMDYTTNTAIAAVKALTEVVTPVVDASGDAQAIEQVRLVTDFVRFVEGRAHWIGDRQRGQLREQVALGNEIRTDIG